MDYFDDDLGTTIFQYWNKFAHRLDFKMKNYHNNTFPLTLYFPCNEKGDIKNVNRALVYCHTHNGNRIEGLELIEKAVENEIIFACFDFNGNGEGSGEYVTLGWYETLDINIVLNFLCNEAKIKHVCLWGRSMGASASIFYLSE